MKLLLDTHILLWTITNAPDLPPLARKLIGDESNTIFFSSVSAWEVELKHEKHPQQLTISGKALADYAIRTGFFYIGVGLNEIDHLHTLQRKENTPEHHDPFDRILICQAAANGMFFLTKDVRISEYTDPCIIYCP